MVLDSMPEFLPWLLIGIGAVLVIVAVILVILLAKRKKKPTRIIVDEEFINNLVTSLGGKENIVSVNVDNARLKIEVSDLDKADLNAIKATAESGVFVTGNIIKTLFKFDSMTIKKALDSVL